MEGRGKVEGGGEGHEGQSDGDDCYWKDACNRGAGRCSVDTELYKLPVKFQVGLGGRGRGGKDSGSAGEGARAASECAA